MNLRRHQIFALLDLIAEENGDDLRAWLAYDPEKEVTAICSSNPNTSI